MTAIPVYLVPKKTRRQHSLEEDASALGPRGEEKTESIWLTNYKNKYRRPGA